MQRRRMNRIIRLKRSGKIRGRPGVDGGGAYLEDHQGHLLCRSSSGSISCSLWRRWLLRALESTGQASQLQQHISRLRLRHSAAQLLCSVRTRVG